MAAQLPNVQNRIDTAEFTGGLDLISPPGYAKAGTCRFATNYEADIGIGYRRMGGFERFSGQPAPSKQEYTVIELEEGATAEVGHLITGTTSAAEGKIVWVSGDGLTIGVTRLLPGFSFEDEETIFIGVDTVVGTIANAAPAIGSFTDNDIAYAVAEDYRVDIDKPVGAYGIRGVAIINNQVFCWRDDEDLTAANIYRATTDGWELVPLNFRISFDAGTTVYVDGNALTQSSVTAEILRVVVTAGTWAGGDAEGYFIIEDPTGGDFAAGAATGAGACNLTGPQTPIALLANGRVETVVANFGGSTETQRLYGCDGINQEFEFDGEVYVPLETGMGNVRARHVAVHKQHLFFSFGPSVQHSATGDPYSWSPLLGAAELTTGDDVTNFVNVPGSETSSSLMISCRNSTFVLYGTDSETWKLDKISDESGAQAYSVQLMGSPMVFDRDGFIVRRSTDTFGNFSYESASLAVEPLVRNGSVSASVLVRNKSQYRCFFADGLIMTATPIKGGYAWMPCDYGRVINVAIGGEINGEYRIFMGDVDGWVLEADVGRSFDGEVVEAGIRMSSQNQRAEAILKQYRFAEVSIEGSSAFHLAAAAEYSDTTADNAVLSEEQMVEMKPQYGAGLFWDFNSWDQAYWDGNGINRLQYPIRGHGRSLSLLFRSASDRELPHVLKTSMVVYTPRRLAR
jgi:hypothetical protein